MLKFNKFPPEKPGDAVWSETGFKLIERNIKDAYPPKDHTPSLEQMHHTRLHLEYICGFTAQLLIDAMDGQPHAAIRDVCNELHESMPPVSRPKLGGFDLNESLKARLPRTD